MKTSEKAVPIEERLKSREFRDKLREHPIVQAKVEQTKRALGIDEAASNPAKTNE